MKNIEIKTALCCIACDGTISPDEVETLRTSDILQSDDSSEIHEEVRLFKNDGKSYLHEYISQIAEYDASNDEKLHILDIAAKMIKADNEIKYSEIKFFKMIYKNLKMEPSYVLENIDGIDEDWVEDDFDFSDDELSKSFFSSYEVYSTETLNLK